MSGRRSSETMRLNTGGSSIPRLRKQSAPLTSTMKVNLASNGWATSASIKVIGENPPSIIGRDLMAELGPQLTQKAPGEHVMPLQNENAEEKRGRIILVSNFQIFLRGKL